MEKQFDVKRLTNGRGESNLLVITEDAIPDISIGTVLIVPYANGYKDPEKVLLKVDENGTPIRLHGIFAIVLDFIYKTD